MREEAGLPQAPAARFELLVQSVTDYAIYMLDPDGVVASWNAGAARFKGYAEHEIIGCHFSRFYTPEDVAREGAAFIAAHIIRVTERAFDDFAGTVPDEGRNRRMLGLG